MTTIRNTCNRACLLLLLPVVCLLTTSCAGLRSPFDAGFVASRDTTPEGHSRLRVLGPLFERQEADGKTFTAVRPFYSRTFDAGNDRTLREYLWPVAMDKDFRGETYWRILLAYENDFVSTNSSARHRFIIFPIFYSGKDIHDESYFAIFPLGGKVNEFLGQDKIWFALFPLYMYMSVNDVRTYDVLWPLISRTTGHDVSRFRFFPFYGQSSKGNVWTKRFVLWPIWTSAHYNYPDGQTGGGFVLFPLFGHTKLTDQETWMLLPPFFRWSRNDKGYHSGNLPWPFIQYASGKNEKFCIWPLWGTRHSGNGNIRSSFFIWPIGSTLDEDRVDYDLHRFSLFPLAFYESKTEKKGIGGQVSAVTGTAAAKDCRPPIEQKPEDKTSATNVMAQTSEVDSSSPSNTPTEYAGAPESAASEEGVQVNNAKSGRFFKLWPLASYQREDEAIRIRFLDLWPGKSLPAVERNFAPFWTLYSHVRVEGASEDELLWGFFRRSNDNKGGRHLSLFPLFSFGKRPVEDFREWSLLMGLTGYKREGLRKTYRVLYFFTFSTKEKKAL